MKDRHISGLVQRPYMGKAEVFLVNLPKAFPKGNNTVKSSQPKLLNLPRGGRRPVVSIVEEQSEAQFIPQCEQMLRKSRWIPLMYDDDLNIA